MPNNGSEPPQKNQPEDRWKYAGMSDAQIQAEKAREQKLMAIQADMRKIERMAQEDNLSRHKKIKKELMSETPGTKVEYKDIAERLKELEKKNFTSNFTSQDRDKHQNAFRNRTDPPEVGKYFPKEPTALGYKSRATNFGNTNKYSESAQ